VIVLDRTVTRVFPSGARLTLTHNIIKVLDKDGIEKWGEVQIPDGAEVLTLRTVKADGSTREPEEIGEKEAVSAPDLEVGDYVEFEYVDPAAPPGAFPDGFLAERFYFNSYDAPLDRTEYLLVTPAGMKLQIDRRGDAPETVVERRGELEVRTFSARKRPQLFQEPSQTPLAEYVASVRAGSGLSLTAWRDYLRDGSLLAWRASPALRALAERETRGAASDRERLARLDSWVRRHVKHGGSLDEPATAILAREEGNRVTLLAGLAHAIGLPCTLWLGRSDRAARLDGPLPDLEAYDQPLLSAAGQVVDPRYRHAATGFVWPPLRGGQALVLQPGAVRVETVPAGLPDTRQMELDVRLQADGSAHVHARERLRGWPALEWREGLEKLAADRLRPEFEQHTLGFYFPGATLEALSWQGKDDDAGELTVDYSFQAPAFARRVGRGLVLGAPYPALLARRFVGVADRTTPLELEFTPETALDATIELPAVAEAQLAPEVALHGPFGKFAQRVERTARGLHLSARFAMPAGRVPTASYREFVEYATRVDHAEAKLAEVTLR
jgi:hypothetical protein